MKTREKRERVKREMLMNRGEQELGMPHSICFSSFIQLYMERMNGSG